MSFTATKFAPSPLPLNSTTPRSNDKPLSFSFDHSKANPSSSSFLGSTRKLLRFRAPAKPRSSSPVAAVLLQQTSNLLITKEEGLELYEDMILGRFFEDKCAEMYYRGKMFGFVHLYNGQEAVSTGFIKLLKKEDYVVSTYRDHVHALSKGVSSRAVMSELFGKATGCCRGQGGSMHMFSKEHNMLGGFAFIGEGIPVATGAAFSSKYRREVLNQADADQVTLAFFGDGTCNNGQFYECLNMAALWKLPIVFVVENNLWAIGMSHLRATSDPQIWKKGPAFGMPGVHVDGMDVLKVREVAKEAIGRARRGEGPTLVECETYRFRGHSLADPDELRDPAEKEYYAARDPITALKQYLAENNLASEQELKAIEKKIDEILDDAVEFADNSPLPPRSQLLENVFADPKGFGIGPDGKYRCEDPNRDVVVSRRNFRQQMDLPELSRRLAMICRSHHSSLVKLLGASVSGAVIFLVYEFVPGASIADCLRNRRNPSFTDLVTWTSRMQIASDVAHGLDYIHNFSGSDSGSGSSSGFVHNHIKSSSIVITEDNLRAKICHFGSSDLCGEAVDGAGEESGGRRVRIEGTRGYMAPEFQVSGVATKKSDVYAFGVVVLELLCGEEAVKFEFNDDGSYKRTSVVDTARVAAGEYGGVRKWMDKRLRDSFPVNVAERMIRVGLDCVGNDPNERPDMGRVSIEVSKLYLESKEWDQKMGTDIDLSVSLAPR